MMILSVLFVIFAVLVSLDLVRHDREIKMLELQQELYRKRLVQLEEITPNTKYPFNDPWDPYRRETDR